MPNLFSSGADHICATIPSAGLQCSHKCISGSLPLSFPIFHRPTTGWRTKGNIGESIHNLNIYRIEGKGLSSYHWL